MLSRRDQENLAARHHQAAASKPLNQLPPTRALAPKTPGRKVPLNDENGANNAGTQGKALKGKAGGLKEKTTFITPAAQKIRAPLGDKTTNARARALATPLGQTGGKAQRIGDLKQDTGFPRSGRRGSAKLKILQDAAIKPAPVEVESDAAEDSDWSVEHCPPPIEPLCDDPIDVFPSNFDYGALTENMMTDEDAEAVLRGLDEYLEKEDIKPWDYNDYMRTNAGAQGAIDGLSDPGKLERKTPSVAGISSRLTQPTRSSIARSKITQRPASSLGPRQHGGNLRVTAERLVPKAKKPPRNGLGSGDPVKTVVRPVSAAEHGKLDVYREA